MSSVGAFTTGSLLRPPVLLFCFGDLRGDDDDELDDLLVLVADAEEDSDRDEKEECL